LLKFLGVIGLFCLGLSLVDHETQPMEDPQALLVPPVGFPEIPFPEDNQFNEVRWQLGRRLFYDPILSADSSISCGSCHMAHRAFSDTIAMSLGVKQAQGTRNAPTLTNVAYNPYFTRDGGVPTLEMQVLVPIQEHNEFNFNIVLIADRMKQDTAYVRLSQMAYGREPDHFVITRALGCFERTIISGNSRYDQHFLQGKQVLNSEELKGKELFFSERIGCTNCHSGFNFTNFSFENNGLYLHYADSGRKRLTDLELDRALFKVPTLRNIALTAPYMHDGSVTTLEGVVEHYSTGGKEHRNKSQFLKPLHLKEDEKQALVSFLLTLTDEAFVNNKLYQPSGMKPDQIPY
jgi:cytochrome c peroxidase